MAFLTTKQFVDKHHVSKHYLYGLIKQGNCPGFKSGNRFNINEEALLAQMAMTESERKSMTS